MTSQYEEPVASPDPVTIPDALPKNPYTSYIRDKFGLTDIPEGTSIFDSEEGRQLVLRIAAPEDKLKEWGLEPLGPGITEEVATLKDAEFAQWQSDRQRVRDSAARYDAVAAPGERPKTDGGFWQRAVDVPKNIFGTAMELLSVPGAYTERTIGSVWFAVADSLGVLDIPDNVSYAELSRYTYETGMGLADKQKFDRVNNQLAAGKPWEEVYKENGGGWIDTIGQAVLDPLNLVGGFWLKGPKTALAIKNASKAERILKWGLIGGEGAIITPSKSKWAKSLMGALEEGGKYGDIPLISGAARTTVGLLTNVVGVPLNEQMRNLVPMLHERDLREALKRTEPGGNAFGTLKMLTSHSNHTMANIVAQTSTQLVGAPFLEQSATLADVQNHLRGLATGSYGELGHVYSALALGTNEAEITRRALVAGGLDNPEKLKSFGHIRKAAEAGMDLNTPIYADPEVHKLAKEALLEVGDYIQQGSNKLFGYDPTPTAVDKLLGGMKNFLTLTMLNYPGFVARNYMENLLKTTWTVGHPLQNASSLLSRKVANDIAKSAGLEEDALNLIAGGSGTFSELAGVAGEAHGASKASIWRKMNVMVSAAGYIDYNMRLSLVTQGFKDAITWNAPEWMGELPIAGGLTDPLKQKLSAAFETDLLMGTDNLGTLVKELNGDGFYTTAKPLLDDWLLKQGMTGEKLRATRADFMDFSHAIDAAIETSPNVAAFTDNLDDLAAEITDLVHTNREAAALNGVGRLRSGYNRAELVNVNKLMSDRNAGLANDLATWLRVNSVPKRVIDDVVGGLTEMSDTVRQTRKQLFTNLERDTSKYSGVWANRLVDELPKEAAYWSTWRNKAYAQLADYLPYGQRTQLDDFLMGVNDGTDQLNKLLRERMRGMDAESFDEVAWDDFFSNAYESLNVEHRLRRELLGIRPKSGDKPPRFEGVSLSEAMSVQFSEQLRFLTEQRFNLVQRFSNPLEGGTFKGVGGDDWTAIKDWIADRQARAKDGRYTAARIARGTADYTALNYDRLYGAEEIMAKFFPYYVWPTRTMHRWFMNTLSNPGRVAAFAKLDQTREDINRDVPERFKNQWRIPVLGLPQDWGGEAFFNPIDIMFSPLAMSRDYSNDDKVQTPMGQIFDYANAIGPSLNPYLPRAAAAMGMGLDREAWLQGQWFKSGPFGMPGDAAIMGLRAWLGPEVSNDQFNNILLGRELTPSYQILQRALKIPPEKWDGWRIRRAGDALFAMEAADMRESLKAKGRTEEQIAAAIEARSIEWTDQNLMNAGPLWDKAKQFASREAGARWIFSYAIGMPISIWPEGERMLKAQDMQYRQASKQGKLAEFYEQRPEYLLYHSTAKGIEDPEERDKALGQTAFFYHLGQIDADLNPSIEQEQKTLAILQANEKLHQLGKHATFLVNAQQERIADLQREKRERINEVKALYADVSKVPSYRKEPRQRGLDILSNLWYDIQDNKFGQKDSAAIEAAQTAAEDKLLRSLPTEPKSEQWWTDQAVAAQLVQMEYGAKISEAMRKGDYPRMDTLKAESDQRIDELTRDAMRSITRTEFERWKNRNGVTPPPQYAVWQQAKEEYQAYLAIQENTAFGLSTNEKSAAATAFLKAHPLINKYYGADEVLIKRNPTAASQLNAIRKEYYELPKDVRLDYLYHNLDRYNTYAKVLGLPAVSLRGYLPEYEDSDALFAPGALPDRKTLEKLLDTKKFGSLVESRGTGTPIEQRMGGTPLDK